MSNELNRMFVEVFNHATAQAELITDPYNKAMVYVELAKALAETDAIGKGAEVKNQPISSAASKTEAKETKETKKVNKTVKKEKDKAPAEEPEEEKNDDTDVQEAGEPEETWTEELQEKYDKQIEYIQQITKEYGEDTVAKALSDFSEGELTKVTQIAPSIIKPFVAHIRELIALAESEDSEEE